MFLQYPKTTGPHGDEKHSSISKQNNQIDILKCSIILMKDLCNVGWTLVLEFNFGWA